MFRAFPMEQGSVDITVSAPAALAKFTVLSDELSSTTIISNCSRGYDCDVKECIQRSIVGSEL